MAEPLTQTRLAGRLHGLLVGTAVGDSLGLPAEGLAPGRIARRWPGRLRHRFLFGRGMISDDTEHAWFVGQSLLRAPRDPDRFARALAWRLRGWLLGVPAGVGFATLRAVLRLWIGFSPRHSGVRSAGNGAAMRAPLLGAFFADDPERRRLFTDASSRLTHVDERALAGARAMAEAVAGIVRGEDPGAGWLGGLATHPDWQRATVAIREAAQAGRPVADVAKELGGFQGVSGYVCHSVPFALYAWWRHRGDFRATVEACVRAGGDTDTTAAMAGALAGTDVGEEGIPAEWREGLLEWPRTRRHFRTLADRLALASETGQRQFKVRTCWPGLLPRNLLLLVAVLAHGFRRLLPPW